VNDIQVAIECELRLLDPAVRRAADQVDAMLDPEFVEFGASGRRWQRGEIIAALAADSDSAAPTVLDLAGIRLAQGVVLVTYTSDDGKRRCQRSSIWRRTIDGWRVLFHQGTLIPPGDADRRQGCARH
jgi:hypothetical protein